MFHFSQLKLPIIQAPMAGGLNTPNLASAVINNGGVGSFGFAYSTPVQIEETLVKTKRLTSGPINTNFFVFNPVSIPEQSTEMEAFDALKALPFCDQVPLAFPKAPFYPDLNAQLEVIWACRPQILTFHLGIPPVNVINKALSLDIAVGITATNLEEALAVERAGASFVVAQGYEAGGHRGNFDSKSEDPNLLIDDLLVILAPEIAVPLLAAGGIMTGQDLVRKLRIGATAVQMGTAFLCCDEAGTSRTNRDYLTNYGDRGTSMTKAFSGRAARGINNEFMHLMEGKETLPFPLQNTLTALMRVKAAKSYDGEYQSFWAGSGFPAIRSVPVSQLMRELSEEMTLESTP